MWKYFSISSKNLFSLVWVICVESLREVNVQTPAKIH